MQSMRLASVWKTFSGSKKITLQKLRRLNLTVALATVAQSVAVLMLFNSDKGAQPLNVSYLAKDTLGSDAAGRDVFAVALRHLADVNLAYAVAAFLLLGAAVQLLAASRYRRRYEAGIRRGINPLRWAHYVLSVGIMLLAVALIVGVADYASLLLIFGLNGLAGVSILLAEKANQVAKTTNWTFYKIGVLAWLLAWLPIAVHIKAAIVYGNGLPAYVYYLTASAFLLIGGLLLNSYLQFKKRGHWAKYLYSELVYVLLSLATGAALTWQIFAGALR